MLSLIEKIAACRLNGYPGRFVRVHVVMDDCRQSNRISFGQEPRHLEPQDQVLAGHYLRYRRSYFGVGGDGASRRPPGSQVVRQSHVHGGLAVRSGHQIGLPECSVLEILANHRLGILAFILEIRELIVRFVGSQSNPLVA